MKAAHVTLRSSSNCRSQGAWTREEQRGIHQQRKEERREKTLQKQERKREAYNIRSSKQGTETVPAPQTNLALLQNLVLHVIGGSLTVAPIAISAWHMFYAK